jgi:sporulation protein YlmC with PRC-barrel domain
MKRTFMALLFATTALVPALAVAQTETQTAPAQQSAAQPAEQGQAQPLTAASLSNQPIYDQSGQQFGQVTSVVRGQGEKFFAVVSADNRQFLVPIERVSFENNRFILQGSDQQFAEYQQGSGEFQQVEQTERINIAGAQGDMSQQQAQDQAAAGQADASRIVVQQAQPSIRVEQGAPQVSVQQPQPQVTVRQANPEILVRQPAPTVTVDIPQPEIIVRMPQPDVNVAMAQPQVEVQQPQPQVQVVQPQQETPVQVQPGQPQVNVQQGQAQVRVEGEVQPQVTYERAEPKVVVNQPQGQPKVTFERMDADSQQQQQAAADAQQPATGQQEQALATGEQTASTQPPQQQQQQQQRTERTDEQRRAYLERFGAQLSSQPGGEKAIDVSQIRDMDVWNGRGERLGEVDEVISINNKPYVVVAHGGFMGIGEDKVAFPIERFALSGENHLVIHGVTEQDIQAMDDWQNTVDVEKSRVADTQLRLPQLQAQQ